MLSTDHRADPGRSRSPWLAIVALVGGPALLYLPLVGYRWDYLSHFAVGSAAVLALVGVGRALRWPTDGIAAGGAALVVLFSVYAELRWFGALVFDWADIGTGGLGACCAAAATLGVDRDHLQPGGLIVVAAVIGVFGFALRFGLGGVPW